MEVCGMHKQNTTNEMCSSAHTHTQSNQGMNVRIFCLSFLLAFLRSVSFCCLISRCNKLIWMFIYKYNTYKL